MMYMPIPKVEQAHASYCAFCVAQPFHSSPNQPHLYTICIRHCGTPWIISLHQLRFSNVPAQRR
jgi:hypothetical protein